MENNFEQIYKDTYNVVLRYVISKSNNLSYVEDIMQNVYTRLYRTIIKDKYVIENPKAFCLNLAKKEIFSYYKTFENIKQLFSDIDISEFDFASEDHNLDDIMIKKEEFEEAFEIIKREDILTQKAIVLYYLEDLKIKDIAKILNQGESNIKNKIYRTVAKLKEEMVEGIKEGEYK